MMRPSPGHTGMHGCNTMRMRLNPLLLGIAALCIACASQAQAPPGGKVSSLGTAKVGGKLLTRDELRACLKQQADRAALKPQLESERTSLDRERQELLQIDESIKTERTALDRLEASAASINTRSKELSAQVTDFNERVAKFQDSGRSGPTADRQRANFEREQKALDASSKELEAERAALGPSADQAVKTYNARIAAREKAASDWNARNAKLTRAVQDIEIDQVNWKADCEGRSFREDDEKAILSGK